MVLAPGALGRVVRRAERVVAPLDLRDEALDHLVRVKGGPGVEDGPHARVRLGTARHEERAAVRRGLARDVVRADPLGAGDDLLLVGADERTQDRHRHGLVDRSDVVERLRGDLAERLAGDDGLGALDLGDALGDAQHDATVREDPQALRHGKGDLALAVAEGDDVEPAHRAGRGEGLDDVLAEPLALVGGLGTPREVHRDAGGAAAADHPRGHGRVEAAGEQRHDLAGGADGKAADAGGARGIDVDAALDDVHDDGDVRVVDVDLLVGERLAQGRAHELVHLEGVQRVRGRGAAGMDLEGRELPRLPKGAQGGRDVLALVEAAAVRERDARDAGDLADGGGPRRPGRQRPPRRRSPRCVRSGRRRSRGARGAGWSRAGSRRWSGSCP